MARNMFYNYDTFSDNVRLDHTCLKQSIDCDNKLEADYIYNVGGKFLGIKAKANSNFNLYFNFNSDNEIELFELIHSFPIALDILDFTYELITTIPAEVNEYINECCVFIDLSLIEKLSVGNYKFYLYYIENGVKKPLYSDLNILSIE